MNDIRWNRKGADASNGSVGYVRNVDMVLTNRIGVIAAVLIGVLGAPSPSAGAEKGVSIFVTGKIFQSLTIADQRGYIMGATDLLAMYALSPSARDAVPSRNLDASALRIKQCMGLMPADKISAVYLKWLEDNPGKWKDLAAETLLIAMSSNCKVPAPAKKK